MNTIIKNTRRHDVTIHPNGQMDISARLAKILNITTGDVINICCDKPERYIFVQHRAPTTGRHEAQCFPTNSRGKHFRCYSKTIAQFFCNRRNNSIVKLTAGKPITNLSYGTLVPLIQLFN